MSVAIGVPGVTVGPATRVGFTVGMPPTTGAAGSLAPDESRAKAIPQQAKEEQQEEKHAEDSPPQAQGFFRQVGFAQAKIIDRLKSITFLGAFLRRDFGDGRPTDYAERGLALVAGLADGADLEGF